MEDIFTPEESKTPVTYGDLITILQSIAEDAAESDAIKWSALDHLTEVVTDKVKELEYNRMRDTYYFINLISEVNKIPNSVLRENYGKYCDEFDRLNKGDKNENL